MATISTAGDLLVRQGLVKKRRRRRQHTHPVFVPIQPGLSLAEPRQLVSEKLATLREIVKCGEEPRSCKESSSTLSSA